MREAFSASQSNIYVCCSPEQHSSFFNAMDANKKNSIQNVTHNGRITVNVQGNLAGIKKEGDDDGE